MTGAAFFGADAWLEKNAAAAEGGEEGEFGLHGDISVEDFSGRPAGYSVSSAGGRISIFDVPLGGVKTKVLSGRLPLSFPSEKMAVRRVCLIFYGAVFYYVGWLIFYGNSFHVKPAPATVYLRVSL
jgi:hypothetical protein